MCKNRNKPQKIWRVYKKLIIDNKSNRKIINSNKIIIINSIIDLIKVLIIEIIRMDIKNP